MSSFVLARRFGLARGFDVFDDELPAGRQERTARETTDAALSALGGGDSAPLFLWVHYWDPHHPYTPPEPYRSAYPSRPYLGEVAYMDAELGRLVEAFEQRAGGPSAIIVVGDHGEGLGDHGEAQHGHLLYQSTMRVPLVVAGPGVASGHDRRAGEHPPRLSHGARPGPASGRPTACGASRRTWCSARR